MDEAQPNNAIAESRHRSLREAALRNAANGGRCGVPALQLPTLQLPSGLPAAIVALAATMVVISIGLVLVLVLPLCVLLMFGGDGFRLDILLATLLLGTFLILKFASLPALLLISILRMLDLHSRAYYGIAGALTAVVAVFIGEGGLHWGALFLAPVGLLGGLVYYNVYERLFGG